MESWMAYCEELEEMSQIDYRPCPEETVESYLEQPMRPHTNTVSSMRLWRSQLNSMPCAISWSSLGSSLTCSTISFVTGLSQHVLACLDWIFGDMKSPAAMAAVISLNCHGFGSPRAGFPGQSPGISDFMQGIAAFALLQQWCLEHSKLQLREHSAAVLVRDVVVLVNGRTANVATTRPVTVISARYRIRVSSIPATMSR